MIRSLSVGATGMIAQQVDLDVVAQNMANVKTKGYKKSRAEFQDMMYQHIKDPGVAETQTGNGPTGIQLGTGSKVQGVGKLFAQGDFESTSNPLDIAIEGDGFFQVTLPNGDTAYTRDGSLKLNSEGQIVNNSGYVLTPEIAIPQDTTQISIAEDGEVSVRQPGSNTPTVVGQIQIARFPNNGGLLAIGKNLFEETESSGSPEIGNPSEDGYGTLAQGFLENSNVQIVEEMIRMISAQRAYEANSKVIITADNILNQAINVKRG